MTRSCDTIAFQAPKFTFGDALMVCHVAYNNQINSGKKVVLCVPKEVEFPLRSIYLRQKKITIELYDVLKEPENNEDFSKLCEKQNWEANFFFQTTKHYKNISFKHIDEWMDTSDFKKTIPFSNYIIVHVTSSKNFSRPPIENFSKHIENIVNAGYKPVMIGTKEDEITALKNYPGVKNYFDQDSWRFGCDSIFENMANIKHASGVFSFSSWSSIFACLSGVPTLEVWNWDQWQHFNHAVKLALGNPIHLFQISYKDPICHNYFLNSFSFAKSWQAIYQK